MTEKVILYSQFGFSWFCVQHEHVFACKKPTLYRVLLNESLLLAWLYSELCGLNFCCKLMSQCRVMMWLCTQCISNVEQVVCILVSVLPSSIICRNECDRQTQRHTTTAYTALSIASCGKNQLCAPMQCIAKREELACHMAYEGQPLISIIVNDDDTLISRL